MTGAYISRNAGESWRMFNLRGVVRFFLFDPGDRKTIYAQTIGLWRSADTGATWRLVAPRPSTVKAILMPDDHAEGPLDPPGEVTALAVDPADSRTLYAAMPDGIRVSRDWGESWKSIHPLVGRALRIYVDPRSPRTDRTLYVVGNNSVAVREKGVWRQGAALASFTDVSAAFPPGGGRLVVFSLTADGLYISSDGGATWRRGGPAAELTAVASSASRPGAAYVSYRNLHTSSIPVIRDHFYYHGVARTTDMGRTWKPVWMEGRSAAPNVHDIWITERFGPGWGENPIHLGVAPADPDVVYGTDYGRTMRSTDGGENWYGVYSRKKGGGYTTNGLDVTTCYGVHFDPFDVRRMFISYSDIGLFRSEDGGESWISSSRGVPGNWANTTYWMEFDPAVRGRVWAVMSGIHDLPRPKMWKRAGTSRYNGGVVLSEDGGKIWRVSGTGLPQTAATHILLDPQSPASARVLYVAGCGRGVFKSSDGGRSWNLKNNGIAGGDPLAWRLARDRGGVLYLAVARRADNDDGALYRSADSAEHWERMQLPPGVNGPNGIAIDREDPRRLYLACWGRSSPKGAVHGGIFLSVDAGATWRNVLSRDQHVYDVTQDTHGSLYACGFESSAWRSTDRGQTWRRIRGYNFKWGHRVIPDPRDPASIFVTTFGGSVWHGPAAGDSNAVEDIVTPEVAYSRLP